MTNPLGEIITRNWMTGTEKPVQIFLDTEIGESVSIANTIRSYTVNRMDPSIQPTIFHLKEVTVPVHSDQNHPPIGSLNSDIGVPRSGRNIDNGTEMNPKVPIVNTISESNR